MVFLRVAAVQASQTVGVDWRIRVAGAMACYRRPEWGFSIRGEWPASGGASGLSRAGC